MTFADLRDNLRTFAPDLPLVFQEGGRPISPGYHVTELRSSNSTGIDCAGKITQWADARLQLLDGTGSTYMTTGKFLKILEKSLGDLPELADLPLLVEFGFGNRELKLLSLGNATLRDGKVVVPLGPARAVCKPIERLGRNVEKTESCCA